MTEADTVRSPKTYAETFDELFPFYLTLGMSAEEYWEGDNTLPYFFRQAWKMKQKQEAERDNWVAWLNGKYITDAITACFAKSAKYPEKPYEKQEELKPKNEKERKKMVNNAAEGFAAFIATKNALANKQKKAEAEKETSNNKQ